MFDMKNKKMITIISIVIIIASILTGIYMFNKEESVDNYFYSEAIDFLETEMIKAEDFDVEYNPDNTFITKAVIITYLKEPELVSIGNDCDLPEFTHREIVKMAVQKYLGTLSTNN